MPQIKRRTTTVFKKESSGLNYEVKTLIVILLLIFAYPVGLILMFMWMDWPGWVKFLIFLPVICIILGVFFMWTMVPFRVMKW